MPRRLISTRNPYLTEPNVVHTDDMNDIILRGLAAEDEARIEASRKRVSGRPKWELLNPRDPYDMGMRGHALTEARRALGFS